MTTARKIRRPRRSVPVEDNSSSLSLSEAPSEPIQDLSEYSLLIFGRPKIGKTTLTSYFPNCHHFMTERGAKSLAVHQRFIESWDQWIAYLELIKEQTDFRTITVDVVEQLWNLCMEALLQELELPEMPDDYGKTHNKLRKKFMVSMAIAQNLQGVGCVFVSHAATTNRTTPDGDQVEDTHLNMTGKILGDFTGSLDVLAYYTFKRGQRVLQIEGDDYTHAGHRLSGHFHTTKGDPIKFIPMGSSPEQSYTNLNRAFSNDIQPKELDFLIPPRKRNE